MGENKVSERKWDALPCCIQSKPVSSYIASILNEWTPIRCVNCRETEKMIQAYTHGQSFDW
jgi:hypothetical protein